MATQYSDTFKQETLRYIQSNSDKSIKDISIELGIAYGTLKIGVASLKTVVLSLDQPVNRRQPKNWSKKIKD